MKCRQDDDESWISDGRSFRLRILRSLSGLLLRAEAPR